MKSKIHQIDSKSKVIAKRRQASFKNLPTEIKDIIIKKLSFAAKGKLRATSSSMKELVDDRQRRMFNNWKRKVNREEFLHLDHFTSNGFHPPILQQLMSITDLIRLENLEPLFLYCQEKLVASFYDQAQRQFEQAEMKLLFTLTMIGALKHLTNGVFASFNRSWSLELRFTINHFYFGVPWAKKSNSTFNFEEEGAKLLTMLARMIWMKRVLEADPNSNVVNTLDMMDFDTKLVMVGSRVKFNRPSLKPAIIECTIKLEANESILEALRNYVHGTFEDWNSFHQADSLKVDIEFKSNEARKGKFN